MSYYNSNYSNPGAGSADGGGNAYYNYGQQQQQPNQQEQQQQSDPQQHQQQAYGANAAYGNPNQWQQPSQPQQQASIMQPAAAAASNNQQPSFFNPATAATVAAMAGSMAQSGMSNPDAMLHLGQSFLKSSSARMIPGLESTMTMLRGYFAVDNRYVKSKMQRICFPFLSKSWKRLQSDQQMPEMSISYALPHSDENAPDLYIPMMSFVTYVLLCAMLYGGAGKFSPEVLPEVATWCLGFQILEVLGIRFGYYMMQAPVAFLDLFSYTGYKYLGLCINMVAGIALDRFGIGKEAYYVFFLYTASAASFFMLKTMANNIPLVTSATGPKREIMVTGFAASQFATMYFVSKTKFLS